ncbi:hypothetical protein BELL_0245g00060 [Botrytis elliptica]|uniref:Uncharacterized protein n=1 Tax=Botrytis elliptica TaxID=278938 RepID=A0A4Z1JMH9_9HELO|nr:hypothetical protein BELL_0245g00060 [Botrytis elliptica]
MEIIPVEVSKTQVIELHNITLPLGSHLFETACHGVDVLTRSNNRNAHVTLYTTFYTSAAVSEDVVYLGGGNTGVSPETGVVVVSADAATSATVCDGDAGEETGEQNGDVRGGESHIDGFGGVLDGVSKIWYYSSCTVVDMRLADRGRDRA